MLGFMFRLNLLTLKNWYLSVWSNDFNKCVTVELLTIAVSEISSY